LGGGRDRVRGRGGGRRRRRKGRRGQRGGRRGGVWRWRRKEEDGVEEEIG